MFVDCSNCINKFVCFDTNLVDLLNDSPGDQNLPKALMRPHL